MVVGVLKRQFLDVFRIWIWIERIHDLDRDRENLCVGNKQVL